MDQRLPFYMVYQPELYWDDEGMCRRDYEYMKCTYPDTAKRIMPYVEEECDRMEYSGSMMFDEYPDQLQLHLLCRRVYDKVRMEDWWSKRRKEMQGGKQDDKWLLDLIHVITWQEILRRRSEYRKYRRKFY